MIKNARITECSDNYHCREENGETVKRGDLLYPMSQSTLKEFTRCPRRWQLGYKDGEADTKAQEWGNLIDCLVLTPEDFEKKYCIAPATYPAKGAKKDDPAIDKPWNWNATYCEQWRKDQGDKIVLKADQYEKAKQAVSRLNEDTIIYLMLGYAHKQVMVEAEWHDPATRLIIPLRGLIDIVPFSDSPNNRILADLKTCQSADPRSWARQVFNFGYHIQAAFYLDMYNLATGEDRTDFCHILSESFDPYETGRRMLSSEFIEQGRADYKYALHNYCKCLDSGFWPGYDENTNAINGWTITEPESWMVLANV